MNLRNLIRFGPVPSLRHVVVVALASLGLVACSGGSSTGRVSSPSCESSSRFCLVSCNLGCTVAGSCAVSEIAQNQPIELQFSDVVNPASVTSGAISLKTATGESPAGQFIVSGSTLVFVPEVRIVGGVTRFGFRSGETYILNLRSGDSGETLRSTSGDRLARAVICSLSVSQGLVDLDGQPPTAQLVVPEATTGVPPDSQIVVRFSELIELSPFAGGSTLTSPIIYQIYKTIPDPQDPGNRICDEDFDPVLIQGVPVPNVLGGTPPRTEVSLQPAIRLPNRVCVEVIITEQVRDLAGRPAERQVFRFFTDEGNPQPTPISESFESDANIDLEISGGVFGNGIAVPTRFGGRGLLGSFDHNAGLNQPPGSNTYVFSTDSQTFSPSATLFGDSITVQDGGVFEFTDFHVPAGVRVLFRGAKPAILLVRGAVRIDGELSVDGAAPSSTIDTRGMVGPPFQNGTPHPGEDAAVGGPGAGAGGRGGEGCLGVGVQPQNNGARGEDCVAPMGSGYVGNVTNAGGVGGGVWPTSGLRASVVYNLFFSITGQTSGGAGGGSFLGVGTQGAVSRVFTGVGADAGPGALPGTVVPFLSTPPPGITALDHFLVGGSGGGGGGTHVVNMSTTDVNGNASLGPKPWHAGGAGGGGGGAVGLRIGSRLVVASGARLSARGGGGAVHSNAQGITGPPAPGGGGSGGSIVMQIDDGTRVVQGGEIDLRGGEGTFITNRAFNNDFMEARGGSGGHGYVRLEATTAATTARLGNVMGPAALTSDNVAVPAVDDLDQFVGFASKWRTTRQIFPPLFLHYRLVCRVNGQQVVYSDDPASFDPANRTDLPIRIYFQGGVVNPATNTLDGEPGPWRDFVSDVAPGGSVNDDEATGFRFMILFDRTFGEDVVVEEVEVTIEA